MFEQIVSELKKIEEQEGVRVIYACESGSRAWGFPSKDSDFDVRFIYIHPTDWYLSIGVLVDETDKLLERKKAGEELDYEPRNEVISRFLENEFQYFEEYVKTLPKPKPINEAIFDRIFREALNEVWI